VKNVLMNLFGGPVVHGHRTLSSVKIGVAFLVISAVAGWAAFNKIEVKQWLTPSETIKATFAAQRVIVPYYSKVKVNFVPVGIVTGVDEQPDGSALITMQIDKDIPAKLGTAPSATIRPTTLLGGNYFVDLKAGGDRGEFHDTIPVSRTSLPVELDRLLATLQPNAMAGTRGFIKKFDDTLAGGGREALQRLVSDVPGSIKPTGEVLDALRGTRPNRDLTDVVSGFETTARALTDKPGQLRAIATDLATTSQAFGNSAGAFSSALQQLPSSLDAADRGLRRLNTTLDTLRDTADDIRPTAKELGKTLDRLDPTVKDAIPVIHDLRDVLKDARPTVEDAVPATKNLTDVFDDLSGPVLNRVNGKVKDLVLGDYHGSANGPYAQTQTQKPIYQELGYMVANLDRSAVMDRNGSTIPFQVDPKGADLLENLIQNNGQARSDTLARSVLDPNRINPPIQPPAALQPPNPGGDNLGTGRQLLGGLSHGGGR
jgi:phospholipid/cholesterol/gamma-HCH transport system substrate-binding protein